MNCHLESRRHEDDCVQDVFYLEKFRQCWKCWGLRIKNGAVGFIKLIVQNKSQLINVSFITMEQVWESGEAAILSGYINSGC